jgi:hypothetical protein
LINLQPLVVHIRSAVGTRGDKLPAEGLDRQVRVKENGMHQAHVSALQAKHAGLEARISEESQRPLPDTATLARLKKEKLRVKEEIAGL